MPESRSPGVSAKAVERLLSIIARDCPEKTALWHTELKNELGPIRIVERIGQLLGVLTVASPSVESPVPAVVRATPFAGPFNDNPNPNPQPMWKPGTKLRLKGSPSGNVYAATSGAYISTEGEHDWRIRYRDLEGLFEHEQWASVSKFEEIPSEEPRSS